VCHSENQRWLFSGHIPAYSTSNTTTAMGMELDNILQLTFGILALLTTIAVSYITWKLAAGMSSQSALVV
jgi:hypothetical protein